MEGVSTPPSKPHKKCVLRGTLDMGRRIKTKEDVVVTGMIGCITIILFCLLFPYTLIISLNVLFPVLAIPFTWQTYLASLCLIWIANIVVGPGGGGKN